MIVRYGVVFCLYFFGGALVFRELESENAKNLKSPRKELKRLRDQLVWNFNVSDMELEVYMSDFLQAVEQSGAMVDPYVWNYYESCFFAGSILTTIGYGHLYPRTAGGQIFTVIYGVFGIPLTLLLLRHLGDKLTKSIYKAIEKVIKSQSEVTGRSLDDKGQSPNISPERSNNNKKPSIKVKCESLKEKVVKLHSRFKRKKVASTKAKTADVQASLLTVIAIAVLIIVFVLISSVVRVYSEAWTMRESTYFWIVTLLTIGLGDYVPYEGRAPPSQFVTAVYYVGTFYLLIGLALVASFIQAVSTLMEGRLPTMRVRSFTSFKQSWKRRSLQRTRSIKSISEEETSVVNSRPRLSTVSIIVNSSIVDNSVSIDNNRPNSSRSIPIILT